jgi:PPK2 family polyphosphate:nucleotide phosphotransferase
VNIKKYKVTGKKGFDFDGFDTKDKGKYNSAEDTQGIIAQNIETISELQAKLYAEGKVALLLIFQAMDAAGKDGVIKHVMSGINPQGVYVYSFKQPSAEELSHDYLWRAVKVLPERGKIAIFNRSYYEDVLIVKVHKLYEKLNIPDRCKGKKTIENRYRHIRNFEDYLFENGIVTVKFFLHMSEETQRKRFLQRIDEKDKNWKFSEADINERKFWDDYQKAYKSAIEATATKNNPWYVVPADRKWYTRVVVSEILLDVMKKINPQYPRISQEQEEALTGYRQKLTEQNETERNVKRV